MTKKNQKNKSILNYFLLLFLLITGVYWSFFVKGKIPMPGDLMTGVYYPWLDYKWGFSTGVPVKNPSLSDIFSQFYPWKYLVIEIFKTKQIPLWNQYSFSGTPILENYHTGVFFPFNIILFLPKNIGWGLFIYGQTLFSAIGMFLLLRFYVKNQFSRIIGALIFSLSGLMTTWVEFGTGVWAASMVPWIFYFILLFTEQQKARYLFLISIFYTSLILAGHAQLTTYSSLIFALFLIYKFFQKKLSLKNFFLIAIYLLFGLGISAIALYPAYSQVNLSIRSSEVSYIKNLDNGLTPWYDFVRLYASDFFGHPSTYNYWGDISYYENSPFLSTIGLILILPFIIKKFRKNDLNFYFVIFCFSVLLALKNPLTEIIYNLKLPLLTYSSASRIMFLTSFCGAILAACGTELLSDNKFKKTVIRFSILLITSLFLGLIFIKIKNLEISHLKISFKNSILPIAMTSSLMTLLLIKRFKNKFIPILLLILIYFDLGRYFIKFNPFVSQNLIYPQTPAIEFLQQDDSLFRIGRLNREIMTPNSWIPYHLSSPEGYDPLALNNYSHFFNRVNGGEYSFGVTRFSEMYNTDINFINALNVKYLLSLKKDEPQIATNPALANLKKVHTDQSLIVYENPNAMPRFYFIKNIVTVNNQTEFNNAINDKKFNPTQSAIIFDNEIKSANFGLGQIKINHYSNNQISLSTTNESNGFLVIAEAYHPGWTAKIDGQDQKIYEVDGALRGIYVPTGQHDIQMSYQPKSFKTGLIVTYIFFGLLLLFSSIFIFTKKW